MNEICQKLIAEFFRDIFAIILTVFAAFVAYFLGIRAGRQLRRKKSVHDVADIFASEAGKWAEQSFRDDAIFRTWHNASIGRLAAHAAYVEACHPNQWQEILPYWAIYRCDPYGVVADCYEGKTKADYIRALYQIADKLREA
jgi:hypothetical protein